MRRLRVGVLFGGRSAEHEVSLRSAASVIGALDRGRYQVVPIKISKGGRWELPSAGEHPFLAELAGAEPREVVLLADPGHPRLASPDGLESIGEEGGLDVVFPVLHGPYGEDGAIQGLLELAGIPYVGAGVTASAVGMDKALMKALFRDRGLPVVPHRVLIRPEWERSPEEVASAIEREFSYPVFVKPANLGSSVGISKVKAPPQLVPAFQRAFAYDRKILIEKGVDARELEVSVLGNDEPIASLPGEIIPSREFYDYRAKYIDEGSQLIIPADLGSGVAGRAQELALAAFRAIDAAGMARVDLFLDRVSGELYLNEINTIPGFTSISMYPKLWEASGLSMPQLVDRLISLALERAAEKSRLSTSYAEENGRTA